MQCPVCRCELPDHSKVCVRCGARFSGSNVQRSSNIQNTSQDFCKEIVSNGRKMEGYSVQPVTHHTSRKNICLLAVAILLVSAVVYFLFFAKRAIDLDKYMTVEFDGYDTCGTVHASLEEEELLHELSGTLNNIEDVMMITGAISWQFNQEDHLSNGDKVILSYQINQEILEKYGIKIKAEDSEYKVSGLNPVQKLDPFQGMYVEFKGISPGISASLGREGEDTDEEDLDEDLGDTENTSDMMDALDYELSQTENIKIGDTITVTVTTDAEEFLQAYGYVFTSESKDYVCEGQPSYLSASEELPEEGLESMKNQTLDVIETYFADRTDRLKQIGDLNYEGYYLLNSKEFQDYSTNNLVYVIYSVTVASPEERFKKQKVFIPVGYEDIVINTDGTAEIDLDVHYIEYTTDVDFMLSVPGFQSLEEMYTELVATKKSDYNYEAVGNLE